MKDKDTREPINLILKAILHADGGSRGNPGESGIGYSLEADDIDGVRSTISYGGWYLGQATNNQAEYHALIWGLENALVLNVRTIEILLDSELVVKQLNGEYKVKNAGIKPLHQLATQLLTRFYSASISHVERSLNSDSDKLANAAMDSASPVGGFHVEYVSPDLLAAANIEASSPVIPPAPQTPGAPAGKEAFGESDSKDSLRQEKTDAERKAIMASGMYYLHIKEHFDAAHALIGYDGECKNLHGHTWDVEAEVKGSELDVVGIVYDFKDLKEDLKTILKQFDHKYLNEVPPFDTFNATAENLARVVYEQLAAVLPAGISVVEIAVWESPIARLVFRLE
ncbi:MAG: 6-carboxytetrahydropterin synthase QueD [Coriobacteriales bacterium]|jgi:queuosine biosynthesis protein QueD|nr:6-carboxytetrahydropterin synthase QueD [Coriobacteriales bacterium]